jgi:hypothetical protein
MKPLYLSAVALGFASVLLLAAEAPQTPVPTAPQVALSNSFIQMKVYPPDTEKGYYRGTRFDWAGVVSSLLYKNHGYFGQWFPTYNPKLHDSIMGPVEEFEQLGFTNAEPGGTFLKIGVGALRRPATGNRRYDNFFAYEIVDSGKWSVRQGPDWIEYTQDLKDAAGYSYIYRKTLRLTKDKPELVLEHSLKNTGTKAIQTTAYDHCFYVIDGETTGPDFVVKVPFTIRTPAATGLGRNAEVHTNEVVFLSSQSAYGIVEGYSESARDYDIRVENRKVKAGVRATSDRPLAKLIVWSSRITVCPEAYIAIQAEPGQEATWRINYEFYTLPD